MRDTIFECILSIRDYESLSREEAINITIYKRVISDQFRIDAWPASARCD